MSVIQTAAGWFGGGDDRIYVDGEKTAGIQGTGTDDYFNDAWSLREAQGLYTGVPVAEGTDVGARMTAYRLAPCRPHSIHPFVPFRFRARRVARAAPWPVAPTPRQRAPDRGGGRHRGCANRKWKSRSAEGCVLVAGSVLDGGFWIAGPETGVQVI